jgi:ABC-2 type transport system ATP-binding protein
MLSVRHLTIDSPNQENQLNDISFEAEKGEILAVIGRNGAGKSLLLRAIADPDIRFRGEITVNHFQSRREAEKVKLQIGYAAQELHLEPYLTGFEYLELIGSFYHLSSSLRVNRILELARKFRCLDGLYSLLERQGPALQQKVGLISSLLHQPPLIIWDEPLLLLDQTAREAALGELKSEVAKGATALIATNDLGLAEMVGDRVIVLDHGQLVTEGTFAQLQHLTGAHKTDLVTIFDHLVRHD